MLLTLDAIRLSNRIIGEYWHSFRLGHCANLFTDPLRFTDHDSWATNDLWVDAAIDMLKQGTGSYEAYVFLVSQNYSQFEERAREFLNDVYPDDGHDDYYFAELAAQFPSQSQARRMVFSEADYHEYLYDSNYGTGYSFTMRNALLVAGDNRFAEFVATAVSEKILETDHIDDFEKWWVFEEQVVGLLIDLGSQANTLLQPSLLEKLRELLDRQLKHDRVWMTRFIEDPSSCQEGTKITAANNAAVLAWRLGWSDLMSELSAAEWYWLGLFDVIRSIRENANLLAWSDTSLEPLVVQRAVEVLSNNRYQTLDGAIAVQRMQNRFRQA